MFSSDAFRQVLTGVSTDGLVRHLMVILRLPVVPELSRSLPFPSVCRQPAGPVPSPGRLPVRGLELSVLPRQMSEAVLAEPG